MQALIKAAHDLAADGRGATFAELVCKSGIGREAARNHIPKLKSRGHLQIVGERRVTNRNRPVAEYAPAKVLSLEDMQVMTGGVVLSNCMQSWIR